MYERISELLFSEGITLFAPIPLGECKITKKYLLDREKIEGGTAIMIAAPYYTKHCDGASISAYAVSRDYHLFYRELFDRIIPTLQEEFPNEKFAGFADHSPIAEIDAAARAGLGVIGRNNMLITEDFSSFIFVGEIITSAVLDCKASEMRYCEDCGACIAACPAKNGRECLSAVTQKKGALTPDEAQYVLEGSCAWGCDICQNVCPHTARAKKSGSIYSAIPFFEKSPIPHPTRELIEKMDDGEFKSRAFSWRGRDCILRNLDLLDTRK